LPEVRDLEEGGASFYGSLDERRSTDECEPSPPEKVGRGTHGLRPVLHRRHGLLASYAQVTHVVEEGRRPYRRLGYRPRLRFRDNPKVLGDELDPPRRPLIFPRGAPDPDDGLPGDLAHALYDLRGSDALLGRDLYVPCAIPEYEEDYSAYAGFPRDPTANAGLGDRPK